MPDVTITSQQRQTAESKAWAKTLSDLLDGNKQSLMQWLQGAQAFSDELSSFAQARMLLTMDAWSTASCHGEGDESVCRGTDFALATHAAAAFERAVEMTSFFTFWPLGALAGMLRTVCV